MFHKEGILTFLLLFSLSVSNMTCNAMTQEQAIKEIIERQSIAGIIEALSVPKLSDYENRMVKEITIEPMATAPVEEDVIDPVIEEMEDRTISSLHLSTEQILSMTEEEIWQMLSDGRFSSYAETCQAAYEDFEGEKAFWDSKMKLIFIPTWTFMNGEKVSVTKYVTVHEALAEYFTDYLTSLYELPEQYCIKEIGGYCFRYKNNGRRNADLSAHSFGSAIDINWSMDGMGSVPVGGRGGIGSGEVVLERDRLSPDTRDYIETLDSSWYRLTQEFHLDWGGVWEHSYRDPMHHSIVGDNEIGFRYYPDTETFSLEEDMEEEVSIEDKGKTPVENEENITETEVILEDTPEESLIETLTVEEEVIINTESAVIISSPEIETHSEIIIEEREADEMER